MATHDVLIVGAGPAGATTAYVLAKAGVQVQLLEKTAFPRMKTCGGGLTHRAYQELAFDVEAINLQAVTWGYVGVNGCRYEPIHGDGPISYLIDRMSFDAFLLQKAINQGATCDFTRRCLSVAQNKNGVVLTTDGGTYHGRYLVGAWRPQPGGPAVRAADKPAHQPGT